MTRYDVYDNELHPGDFICWIREGTIRAGKIHSISLKGIIHTYPWSDRYKMYSSKTQQVKSSQIIKTAGLPKENG